MAKDPAFLFYDGDAARDVSHMNRLERGCYFDLIQAQKKFGGYTMEQIKKIIGKDFDECWPALELVLKEKDGIYFIEWVRDSIEDRKVFAEKNRKRIQEYWDKKKENDSKEIPRNNHGTSNEVPYVNENEIEDVIVNTNSIKGVFKVFFENEKFCATWKEFAEMRKKIKKPMTSKAEHLILTKLEILSGGVDKAILILERSIENSWQGVFPLNDLNDGKKNGANIPTKGITTTINLSGGVKMGKL